jgi:hypothetical protein
MKSLGCLLHNQVAGTDPFANRGLVSFLELQNQSLMQRCLVYHLALNQVLFIQAAIVLHLSFKLQTFKLNLGI